MNRKTLRMMFRWTLTAILPFWVLLLSCTPAQCEESFPRTYREMALGKADLPAVMSSHPRLFVRREPWSHGPSLVELKQWSEQGAFKSYLGGEPWDKKPRLEWAFRYLVTEDETLVEPIVRRLKQLDDYWPGYLTGLATIYDWLYRSPNFRADDKRQIEDKIINWARAAISKGEQYHDMWSHFGFRPVTDLAAAGLALHGHRPEADEFLALAGGYLKKNFLPGWQLNGGAWQGGWNYYDQGPSNLMTLIHLWSAGTDENLYELIAREQGDWLRRHLHFLISSSYGDEGPLETGGFSYAPFIGGMLEAALPVTYAYQDPNGIAYFDNLKTPRWRAGIWQFIFFSPEMRHQNVEESTLPLSQIWGREGVGYVQMRSGWGEDETLIDFKCGDYFWSHQFHNQNAFSIYRGGKLAVQSGIYGAYWGPHVQFYYRPTVGANGLLVIDPAEKTWIPPDKARQYGVASDNGFLPVFGGQRSCFMHPDYGSAETCFSFDKYLYRKHNEHYFETGTLQGWEVGTRYTYASGDATMAYNNPRFAYPDNTPKVDHVSRDLVFLDKTYLVVFDRVNALQPEFEKRWLLHTVGEPRVFAEKIAEEVPGHITTYDAGLLQVDNGAGTLFVETVFPKESILRVVGGAPSLTAVKPDSVNRGNATLDPVVTGQYAGMGGSIATDAARPERWVLEFVGETEFQATGSITGADGRGHLGERFLSKSYALLIPGENWHGQPQKGDRFTFETTSPSYRFWVDGRNPLPNVKTMARIFKDGSRVAPGNWRIEVSPGTTRSYDSFLHLLTPTDREKAQPPKSAGLRSDDGRLTGLAVADWVVMFVELEGLGPETRYHPPRMRDSVSHLLLGLQKNRSHTIELAKTDGTVFEKRRMTSSSEGTLSFSTEKAEIVTLTVN